MLPTHEIQERVLTTLKPVQIFTSEMSILMYVSEGIVPSNCTIQDIMKPYYYPDSDRSHMDDSMLSIYDVWDKFESAESRSLFKDTIWYLYEQNLRKNKRIAIGAGVVVGALIARKIIKHRG